MPGGPGYGRGPIAGVSPPAVMQAWNVALATANAPPGSEIYYAGQLQHTVTSETQQWAAETLGAIDIATGRSPLPGQEHGSELLEAIQGFAAVATGGIGPVIGIALAEISGEAGAERERVEDIMRYGEVQTMALIDYGSNLGGASFPIPTTNGSGDSIWPSVIEAVTQLGTAAIQGALGDGVSRPSVSPGAFEVQEARLPMPVGAGGAAMAAVGAIRAGARLILRTISARIGQRVTAKNVVALVKRVGPEAAAAALGVTVAEIMQLITVESMKRRRRRGISARDISRARSTIRRVTGFMSLVSSACPSGVGRFRRRHRPGCACVVCRRAA